MAKISPSQLSEFTALTGDELVVLSQLSTTTFIEETTISAQASDNSFNDSGAGFLSAGFAVGQRVQVIGFVAETDNNIYSGVITALTASKMILAGDDGDVIQDEAAGNTVRITKWNSVRTTLQDIKDFVTAP